MKLRLEVLFQLVGRSRDLRSANGPSSTNSELTSSVASALEHREMPPAPRVLGPRFNRSWLGHDKRPPEWENKTKTEQIPSKSAHLKQWINSGLLEARASSVLNPLP